MRAALTWNVQADVEQEHEPSLDVEKGLDDLRHLEHLVLNSGPVRLETHDRDDSLSFGEPARHDRRVREQHPHEHAPGQCDRADEEEKELPCADA